MIVDAEQLVGVAEIADAAGVTRGRVSQWTGRDPSFPHPVAHLALGPVWLWPDVAAWLADTGRERTPAGDRVGQPVGPYDRYDHELAQVDGFIRNGLTPHQAAAAVAGHTAHDHGLPVRTMTARLRHLWPGWKARERARITP